MTPTDLVDVAVVGSGPAGAATATALCAAGVPRVVLVDQGLPGRRPPVGESVPPDTRLLLGRLGAWPAFVAGGHDNCVGSASAWGSDVVGHNDFVCNPHGTGWHLDRARFDASLREHAVGAGAELRRPFRVDRATAEGEHLALHACGQPAIAARFVVDASGQGAHIARMLGARRNVHHRLTCAAAILALPPGSPLNRMTLLEAVEYGWWYAARVPGDRASALVVVDPADLRRRALHTADGWLAHMRSTRHLADALHGAAIDAAGVHVHAAPSALLDPCAGDVWVAVGDAASAFDPLSSQGIHKALADGLAVAPAIVKRLDGDSDALAAYSAAVAVRFEGYQRDRLHFYAMEQRWPDAPFWRDRRSPSEAMGGARVMA